MAGLADILSRLQAGEVPAREPMAPFYGAGDVILDRQPGTKDRQPDSAPSWYRAVQPYPVNIPAAVMGALEAEGFGPMVQGAKSMASMLRQAAGTPAAKAVAAGGAGLALTPSTANPQTPGLLDKLLEQQGALTRQRDKAVAERDLQVKGGMKNGQPVGAGRGGDYQKAVEEIARLDVQLGELNKVLVSEQKRIAEETYRNSPEGKREAELRRKKDELEEAERLKGLPVREHLPGWAQNTILPAATLAGVLMTRKFAGNANAEYQRALTAFDSAMKSGDVPAMSLAQKTLANLENPSVGQKIKTGLAAFLPAEIRLAETGIDLSKDKDTKAHKDALERVSNPWSLGYDVGSSLLASGLSYGMGSKLAKPYVDRGRGAAIASGRPFENASPLASGYANALRQGEDVRKLLPAPPAGAPGPAEAQPGLLSRILGALSGKGSSAPTQTLPGPSSGQSPPLALPGPAPQPATSPSLTTSDVLKGMKPANRNYEGGHWEYQPRDKGKFAGAPEYPDKPKK